MEQGHVFGYIRVYIRSDYLSMLNWFKHSLFSIKITDATFCAGRELHCTYMYTKTFLKLRVFDWLFSVSSIDKV